MHLAACPLRPFTVLKFIMLILWDVDVSSHLVRCHKVSAIAEKARGISKGKGLMSGK
jgi:hypothetical protein